VPVQRPERAVAALEQMQAQPPKSVREQAAAALEQA
jgi:hypothetical protein